MSEPTLFDDPDDPGHGIFRAAAPRRVRRPPPPPPLRDGHSLDGDLGARVDAAKASLQDAIRRARARYETPGETTDA